MKKSDVEVFHTHLLAMRARLSGEVMHLTDEAFGSTVGETTQPNHMAELGSATFEQELTLQMLESEENIIGEINEALDRIAEGTYGICEGCKRVIPKPRLTAIPYARYCVECARANEQEKGGRR